MRKLAWVVAILGTVVLVVDSICGIVNLAVGDPWQGRTTPEAEIRPKCRVAVLGDAQKGLANLANVLKAVKKEKVDFILQTGDLVSNNDEGHYRLVGLYLRRADLAVPFVVVPGNHDTKGGPGRFERHFGPLEGSRVRTPHVAFVVVNNAFGPPPELKRVEELIAAAPRHDAVVLAMHVPPFDLKGDPRPEYAEFLAWLEKSRIKYLLCGHVHGYFKKGVGETTVIVNGVGGDYDKWQLDQKVYATILEVDGTAITDRTIELPPSHGFVANLEHLAIGHVAEAYRRRPLVCWGVTVVVLFLTGFAFHRARLPKTA